MMKPIRLFALAAILGAGVLGASWQSFTARAETTQEKTVGKSTPVAIEKVVKTEAEWRKLLSPVAFNILRQQGTERAFSGDYKSHGEGIYRCAGCGLDLFTSETKYDSRTGWPSFWKPIAGHVIEKTDADGQRTEVECARCDGHLGHVFNDGPKPTGLRYCMNAGAMTFQKTE